MGPAPACRCQAVLAGRPARGRARPSRAALPPTLGVLKGPLVRPPCLPPQRAALFSYLING